MKKFLAAAAAIAAFSLSPAQAGGVNVGLLTCSIDGGVGFIIGSSKSVDCVFRPADGGHDEHYEGSIGKLGIDIGVTRRATVEWLVFAPGKTSRGALKGSYGGASAEATIGVGLGANALVGGFKKSIALQPLSVQAQTGLNIAAGIAGLRLDYVD